MNKVYKVKKNAAGNLVACSEFAKGHAKKAVLGSLLVIAVLGMATTASAQQTGNATNKATGDYSTINGGVVNQATGVRSTVAGGADNQAKGTWSTVSGGKNNHATGTNSTIGGGYKNQATGIGSFAVGTENQANTENAVAVGKKNIIDGDNSAAIGSNNTVENDKKDVFILGSNTSGVQSNSVLLGSNTSGKEATTVNNATVGNLNLTGFAGTSKSENGVVSVGSEGGERQIVNVGAGKISATSTDAVNGSQLHALATAVSQKLSGNINTKTVESLEKAVSQNQDDIAKNKADADAKFKGVQTDIANNKTTLAQHTKKIDDNQQAIEAKLGGKADVQKLAELKTSVDKNQADADAKFTATEVAIAKNTQSITTLDSKVNTFDGRISALDAKVNGFDGRINALDDKFKNGMAAQAALNGLFQPYSVGKLNATAALGGYGSKTAIAIGAGYRASPQLAFKGGAAINMSGSKKGSYNVGVNYEF